MAKLRFGPAIESLSGASDGVIFATGRDGPILRKRQHSKRPRSTRRDIQTSRLAYLAQIWRTRLEGDRFRWRTLAGRGQSLAHRAPHAQLGALELFVKLNAVRMWGGLSSLNVPNAPSQTPKVNALSLGGSATTGPTLQVSWVVLSGSAAHNLDFYCTPAMSAGIQTPKPSWFRWVRSVAANAASPQSLLTQWQTVFGTLAPSYAGRRIFVELRPRGSDGYCGPRVRASCVLS